MTDAFHTGCDGLAIHDPALPDLHLDVKTAADLIFQYFSLDISHDLDLHLTQILVPDYAE